MTAAVATVPDRRVPPLGGFSLTFLRLEVRRLLRNRRTMVFTLIMPPAFFLLFGGLSDAYQHRERRPRQRLGLPDDQLRRLRRDARQHQRRRLGRRRAGRSGWSRQLRLTPLNPVAYMVTKVLTAMVVGAMSVAIVFAVGALSGAADMPGWVWLVSGLVAWLGAIVFAAFGLFIGYLVPSENVMQLLGPALALLALMGGIFVPLDQLSDTLQTLADVTPRPTASGVLARAALLDDRRGRRRDRQRRRLDGAVRRRRGVAVPPRHRPGLSAESHCSP